MDISVKTTKKNNIVEINNIMSIKMAIYFQHYNNNFVFSSYSLLTSIISYYITTTNDDIKKEIERTLFINKHSFEELLALNRELAIAEHLKIANCIFVDKIDSNKQNVLLIGTVDKRNCSMKEINKYVKANIGEIINESFQRDYVKKFLFISAIKFDGKIHNKVLYNEKDHLMELYCEDNNFTFGMWTPNNNDKILVIQSNNKFMEMIKRLKEININHINVPDICDNIENINIHNFLKFIGLNICCTDISIVHKIFVNFDNKTNNTGANHFLYYVRHVPTNLIMCMGIKNKTYNINYD